MMKINRSHILLLLACVLCVTCALSVLAPMRFDGQRQVREQAVKERLMKIRHAEEKYRKAHGEYAGDFKSLVEGGFLADSLQYIPYSENKKFDLTTTTITGKSGRNVPAMECGATYNNYLSGLDENSISNLIEAANNAGRYPGLKIGDTTTANDNAGNWE